MKFSAQEEYGLRCLVAIAEQGEQGSLTIPEIAVREGLSEPHAAKLLTILRKEGFVRSSRGQIGGYRLAKPATQVIVGDVLYALGGHLFDNGFCERHAGLEAECVHYGNCSLNGLWAKIQNVVDQVVYKVTLQDLIDGKLSNEPAPIYFTRRPGSNGQAAPSLNGHPSKEACKTPR